MTHLRTTTFRTTKSVREFSEGYRLTVFDPTIRGNLNVKQLIEILKKDEDDIVNKAQNGEGTHSSVAAATTTSPMTVNEKKRGPQRGGPKNPNGKKKQKLQAGVKETSSSVPSASETEDEDDTETTRVTVPVSTHTFEVAYTRKEGDGYQPWRFFNGNHEHTKQYGWIEEETELLRLLETRADGAGAGAPIIRMDLGTVSFRFGAHSIRVFQGKLDTTDRPSFTDALLHLPRNAMSFDNGEAYNDVLVTCYNLHRHNRIRMTTCATLIYTPSLSNTTTTTSKDLDLPFQIHITIQISLVLPTIFAYTHHPGQRNSLMEDQRQLLTFLFCSPDRTGDCRPHNHDQYGKYRVRQSDNEDEAEGESSLRRFYGILQPAPWVEDQSVLDALQPKELQATLLPFQRRSVKWLLERESMTVNKQGQIIPKPELDEVPMFWREVRPIAVQNGDGVILQPDDTEFWYFNRMTGSLLKEKPLFDDIHGAMLCEEMGLGKTLECIALIMLNPPLNRVPTNLRYDSNTELHVSETNLIVTPATLSQQWMDELHRHAPSLKALFYTGHRKLKLPKVDNVAAKDLLGGSKDHHAWCKLLEATDVVVITYKTLQDELGIAKAPIIRPRRHVTESTLPVEKTRSPLVRVEWARVFMDEVQQVGGGKTAEMVSLIPRKVSIAVSGTPAKSKVADLSHVLKFLRLERAIGRPRTWERLLSPNYHDLFMSIFQKYAIRTLKSSVKDELTIPLQRRFAVGIEFGKVETHLYNEALQEALNQLGVDARGVTVSEGWEIDMALLRSWLRKLRQICTHPQVGHLTRATISKPATIKTMHEVLQDLRDKNGQSLITDRRIKIQLSVRRAQLLQKAEQELEHYQTACGILLQAKTEANQLISDIQVAIDEHEERGKKLREETARLRRERAMFARDIAVDFEGRIGEKGKGKEKEGDDDDDTDDSMPATYVDDEDLPRTRAGDDYLTRRRNLQVRMREVLVLKHKVVFFLGDAYHLLQESHLEDDAYGEAEEIRKSLLKSTSAVAEASMESLRQNFQHIAALRKADFHIAHCGKGGIRSTPILADANDVIDLLNEQGALLWQWRSQIYPLLTETLSNEGKNADGEEYMRSLDTQGEVEAYLQAYVALIADRKETLTAERTALAKVNEKAVVERNTMATMRAQDIGEFVEDDQSRPEQDDALQAQLAHDRKFIRDKHGKAPLKAAMFSLGEIGNRAGNRSEENQIAKDESKRLRAIITQQGKFIEKLELECASFRKTFNDRILYFRQLQELSDTVMDAEWEGDVLDAVAVTKTEEDLLAAAISRKRAQGRHLDNLAKTDEDDIEDVHICAFCHSEFTVGLMLSCAHVFCEPCLTEWMKGKRFSCPICRAKFKPDTLERISFGDNSIIPQLDRERVEMDKIEPDRSIQLNTLPKPILNLIQTYEAHGSYGSKIMHLIRHLLYLQDKEPGTKSVIFSAWSDSLAIIEHALVANGISCIKVDQKGKQDAAQKFKTDPGIIVFLLHGERENAGLNLTCAKRVWLLEPTVNHSFEVQAISRVDRMGQSSSTEVYCYYIENSVEENILRMGAKRGFSLYTLDHAEDMLDITEYSMGSPNRQKNAVKSKARLKGDFIEKPDDLLHVLFPHLDYDEEAILAESRKEISEFVPMDVDESNVAGPSRIRS